MQADMIFFSENVGKVSVETKFPCAVWRKGGDIDSILYQLCWCWVHKRYSDIRGKGKENSKFISQT